MKSMKMNAPCIPLATVDPYFSLWSKTKELNKSDVIHWTWLKRTLLGEISVDGEKLRFMGLNDTPEISQKSLDIYPFSTAYTFANEKIELNVNFFSPLLITDLYLLSRPVSYITVAYRTLDGKNHDISVKISASEEHCIDIRGSEPVITEELSLENSITAIRIGSKNQDILNKTGDEIGINWGYFYLAAKNGNIESNTFDGMEMISISACLCENEATVFALAYDDIYSIEYFGERLSAYWKRDQKDINSVIVEAIEDYDKTLAKCDEFALKMLADAKKCGGEKYADLLTLSYRQIFAAHKLVIDKNDNILYISKECSSNGCAATVDITYPTSPIFLLYNPQLLKGSMLPVMEFAEHRGWKFDFAPHDVGCYPKLNGQVYSDSIEGQMPVEECGNMLILFAALAKIENNGNFAEQYKDTLSQWVKYLIEYGNDPADQLCTDDFAGRLAHNCNLSVKAIMGVASYSILLGYFGQDEKAAEYLHIAKEMAINFKNNASNGDGSLRLAFDKPGSFSMKYNMIWDNYFGEEIFDKEVKRSEFLSYFDKFNQYGLPLDSRKGYSKSDWLLWCGSFAETNEEFDRFITPLWNAYNETSVNVPMTDWYYTETGDAVEFWWEEKKENRFFAFKHRAVQGGLFMKLLLDLYQN